MSLMYGATDSVEYGIIRPTFRLKRQILTITVIVIFITYIMFPTNAITKTYEYPEFITGARRN